LQIINLQSFKGENALWYRNAEKWELVDDNSWCSYEKWMSLVGLILCVISVSGQGIPTLKAIKGREASAVDKVIAIPVSTYTVYLLWELAIVQKADLPADVAEPILRRD
jgi:amino acid permease